MPEAAGGRVGCVLAGETTQDQMNHTSVCPASAPLTGWGNVNVTQIVAVRMPFRQR